MCRPARRVEKDRADIENKFRSWKCTTGNEFCCVVIHQDFVTEIAYHSSLSDVPAPESKMLIATKFFPRAIAMAELWPSS